ncbi:hypothetical protein M427DRAFT_60509 [Gonapodya prolifera JEL478]|uniref:Uncharacterized protein n=1 Tax=Gonapodya prolifera (strain JEL478) TaxID=1344416 RepID=A0A139A4D0_GONPJ|nr:hypothetical protein M427DRAFT_60509 [Gonapodya prolifera JEL478]|eukprot:KXS11651.1 hypothetical protein M427DRAFT_60509 [Gonapodya prolifera JEL478]
MDVDVGPEGVDLDLDEALEDITPSGGDAENGGMLDHEKMVEEMERAMRGASECDGHMLMTQAPLRVSGGSGSGNGSAVDLDVEMTEGEAPKPPGSAIARDGEKGEAQPRTQVSTTPESVHTVEEHVASGEPPRTQESAPRASLSTGHSGQTASVPSDDPPPTAAQRPRPSPLSTGVQSSPLPTLDDSTPCAGQHLPPPSQRDVSTGSGNTSFESDASRSILPVVLPFGLINADKVAPAVGLFPQRAQPRPEAGIWSPNSRGMSRVGWDWGMGMETQGDFHETSGNRAKPAIVLGPARVSVGWGGLVRTQGEDRIMNGFSVIPRSREASQNEESGDQHAGKASDGEESQGSIAPLTQLPFVVVDGGQEDASGSEEKSLNERQSSKGESVYANDVMHVDDRSEGEQLSLMDSRSDRKQLTSSAVTGSTSGERETKNVASFALVSQDEERAMNNDSNSAGSSERKEQRAQPPNHRMSEASFSEIVSQQLVSPEQDVPASKPESNAGAEQLPSGIYGSQVLESVPLSGIPEGHHGLAHRRNWMLDDVIPDSQQETSPLFVDKALASSQIDMETFQTVAETPSNRLPEGSPGAELSQNKEVQTQISTRSEASGVLGRRVVHSSVTPEVQEELSLSHPEEDASDVHQHRFSDASPSFGCSTPSSPELSAPVSRSKRVRKRAALAPTPSQNQQSSPSSRTGHEPSREPTQAAWSSHNLRGILLQGLSQASPGVALESLNSSWFGPLTLSVRPDLANDENCSGLRSSAYPHPSGRLGLLPDHTDDLRGSELEIPDAGPDTDDVEPLMDPPGVVEADESRLLMGALEEGELIAETMVDHGLLSDEVFGSPANDRPSTQHLEPGSENEHYGQVLHSSPLSRERTRNHLQSSRQKSPTIGVLDSPQRSRTVSALLNNKNNRVQKRSTVRTSGRISGGPSSQRSLLLEASRITPSKFQVVVVDLSTLPFRKYVPKYPIPFTSKKPLGTPARQLSPNVGNVPPQFSFPLVMEGLDSREIASTPNRTPPLSPLRSAGGTSRQESYRKPLESQDQKTHSPPITRGLDNNGATNHQMGPPGSARGKRKASAEDGDAKSKRHRNRSPTPPLVKLTSVAQKHPASPQSIGQTFDSAVPQGDHVSVVPDESTLTELLSEVRRSIKEDQGWISWREQRRTRWKWR